MLSLQELQRYDWMPFYDCTSNCRNKKSGAKVGQFLAVSGYNNRWQIFNVVGGLPVIDCYVSSLPDAVKIARFIDEKYNIYLALWQVYPDWDIPMAARLSIPHGEAIYNALCGLAMLGRNVNYQDLINQLAVRMQ
jgi:hypothetical protein